MDEKVRLRASLRSLRNTHVAALPAATRRLLFLRPPVPVVAMIPQDAPVGLYWASANEAPSLSYARWFHENGRVLALPWMAGRDEALQFRRWADPYDDDQLVPGPFGVMQPRDDAPLIDPGFVFVPLVGFTRNGARLGQGGGHYDRWLAEHPQATALGLAWDCQLVDALPMESHDRKLQGVITPTRFHQPAD